MEPELDIFEELAKRRANKHWIVRKINFISMWWQHDGRFIHRSIKLGIKNILYWLPIIWKDRHWDSHYIFEIMKHKIKAQSKYIGGRDIHTRAKRDAEIMMTCVRLMEKVQDEFYSLEYTDYHKTKNWFEDMPGKEGYSSWESRILEDKFKEYFKKYPLIYQRVLDGEGPFNFDGTDSSKVHKRIAMNIGHINQERAHKLLFKIIEQNITKWWD